MIIRCCEHAQGTPPQPIAAPPHPSGQQNRIQVNYTFMKKLLLTSFALIALVLTTHAERIFVLTSANRLITIDSAEPGTAITTVPITGLGSGESLVGIDFRPG